MFTLSPIKRRLLYVISFEFFAVLLSTIVLSTFSGGPAEDSLPVAIMVSSMAVVWNYLYNTLFEFWEARRRSSECTLIIRSMHTLGFEAGLFLFCLPLYMLWYAVSVEQAMMMEFTILVFFLVFTFMFTLLFDQIFTLPNQEPRAAFSKA